VTRLPCLAAKYHCALPDSLRLGRTLPMPPVPMGARIS
jgi:hypothetical protein